MSENWYSKFVPVDWKGDPELSRCSAETRGVWIDAIATMMILGTDRLIGTNEELARDCRCNPCKINAIHKQLTDTNTATTSEQNGCKTWICRRLSKELQIKGLRSASASSRWCKNDAKGIQISLLENNTNNKESLMQKRCKPVTITITISLALIDKWNSLPLRKCLLLSEKRKSAISARLREDFFKDNWKGAMDKVVASDFCLGKNDRGWKADLDWFLRPDTVAKIMEGKYDNAPFQPQAAQLSLNVIAIQNQKALERAEARIKALRDSRPVDGWPKNSSELQELKTLKEERARLMTVLNLKA